MTRNNHLYIGRRTDLRELAECIDKHGESISYLKIGSVALESVNVQAVCDMIKGSAISVCLGGGIIENTLRTGAIPRLKGIRLARIKKFAKSGVDAIEIPCHLLENKEIVDFTSDHFRKRVIEVGVKKDCMSPFNSPTNMLEQIQAAEVHKPNHIVLEGALTGDVGIYHLSGNPNILAVDQLIGAFADISRCIIEAPYLQTQNLWRLLYGPKTHIGNIYELGNVNKPLVNHYAKGHWKNLRKFRKRLEKLGPKNGLSWDDIARNKVVNVETINRLPELAALKDKDLLPVLLEHVFEDSFATMRVFMESEQEEGRRSIGEGQVIQLGNGRIILIRH